MIFQSHFCGKHEISVIRVWITTRVLKSSLALQFILRENTQQKHERWADKLRRRDSEMPDYRLYCLFLYRHKSTENKNIFRWLYSVSNHSVTFSSHIQLSWLQSTYENHTLTALIQSSSVIEEVKIVFKL